MTATGVLTLHVRAIVFTLLGVCLCAVAASAQSVPSRVDMNALSNDAKAAYHAWESYLASKSGRISSAAGTPSPYWVAEEQRRWPVYDLAGFYLRDDARPEILAVERVTEGTVEAFRITTEFQLRSERAAPATWWSDMTVTVIAVREAGTWKIANALPWNTRTWRRDTVGPITYVRAVDHPFNRARAERAVTFTDSLATAFGVPPLAPLTYYLLPDVDAVYRIMGLESQLKFGATGGAAQPVNRQLFSGIPAVGEEYRHELAHLVLAPLLSSDSWYLISEGVPTWVGGTAGADFPTAARALADVLAQRPALSLDSIVTHSYPNSVMYPAGAVLTVMVFDQGGTVAVKTLLRAGPTREDMQRIVAQLLQRSWPDVVRDWRMRVMSYAARPRD